MTKRDYAKIAAVIAEWKPQGPTALPEAGHIAEQQRVRLAREIAAALRGTNPNYDEARFLAACEVEP